MPRITLAAAKSRSTSYEKRRFFFAAAGCVCSKCFYINKLQFSSGERYRLEEASSLLRKGPRVFGERRSLIINPLYLKHFSDSSSGNHPRYERDNQECERRSNNHWATVLASWHVLSRCPKRPAERRCRKACRRLVRDSRRARELRPCCGSDWMASSSAA